MKGTILRLAGILLLPWIILGVVAGALFVTGVVDRQKVALIEDVIAGRPLAEPTESDMTREEAERVKAEIEQRLRVLDQREENFDAIEAVLNEREQDVHSLETELAARKQRLLQQIEDFRTKRAAWRRQVAEARAAAQAEDFKNAVKNFEKMPPKSAARIMYDLEDEKVLRFLRAMRSTTRSDILAQIEKIDAEKNRRDLPAGPEDPRLRNRSAELQAKLAGEETPS